MMYRCLKVISIISILFMFGCGPGRKAITIPDGGFESGSLKDWHVGTASEGASYKLGEKDVRQGRHCLVVTSVKESTGPASFFSVEREFDIDPSRFNFLKLKGYIKGTKNAKIGMAALSGGKSISGGYSYPFSETQNETQWNEISMKIFVPPNTEKLKVICLVWDVAEARFDDFTLEETPWEYGINMIFKAPGIVRYGGAWDPEIVQDAKEYEFTFPLPVLTAHQVPVNFMLEIDPPDKVISSIVSRRIDQNWICKIVMGPVKKGDEIKIRSWFDIFMTNEDFSKLPAKAPIPAADAYPEEIRAWLQPTISVQSGNEKIQAEAKRIMETAGGPDAVAYIRVMLDAIKRIRTKAPRGCDAVTTLENGGACTSRANLGAALCRAAGIPARLIACCPTHNYPLQTHYIIEAYILGWGWVPVETTKSQFPSRTDQYVCVDEVQVQDEQNSFDENRQAGRGVPRWSMGEFDTRLSWISYEGQPAYGMKYCDHIAYPLAQYEPSEEADTIFLKAKEVWTNYLEAKSGKTAHPGLVGALEDRNPFVPKSLADLLVRLEALLKK